MAGRAADPKFARANTLSTLTASSLSCSAVTSAGTTSSGWARICPSARTALWRTKAFVPIVPRKSDGMAGAAAGPIAQRLSDCVGDDQDPGQGYQAKAAARGNLRAAKGI